MAKSKTKSKSKKSAPKKTIKIKKPNIKLGKIKFKKPDFKNILSNKIFKTFLVVLGAVLVFILIDLFFQYLNNDYSVAVIDGVRIPKSTYHKRLESQYGQSTAQQLIDEQLIKLEAKKMGVTASEDEIQERLDDIITSIGGQDSYEAALVANNITEQELKLQIELDILATKILEPELEYTEEDLKEFFDQYSSVIFPTETAQLEEGEKLDYELYKEDVEDIYIQQEVENSKFSWLERLSNEYRIQDNSTVKPKYGVLTATINIFSNMFEEINSNGEAEE